jgi:hypothetical protein
LTLAFWSTIAKDTFGAAQFGTSWEFKAYRIYSVVSIFMCRGTSPSRSVAFSLVNVPQIL